MSDYIRTDIKVKQNDGTFLKYSPTVTLDSVLVNDSDLKLSDILTNNAGQYSGTAAKANSVPWSGVTGRPTTLSGYGITDTYTKTQINNSFVPNTDVTTAPAPNKLLKLDSNAKIPASAITGKLSINNIPVGALERVVVVADDAARFKLTTDQVQTGDTVKVTSTGIMYFVKDDSQLVNEDGYEVYTAGTATSVPWSGVTGKPTTLVGYGITDAATSNSLTSHTDNRSNPHGVTKTQIGLGNVDNTSDANKPISTATQIALNGKQDTITGGATSITSSNLTASRVLVSNSSGKVSVSTVTSTELGYLGGVTSAIQTQLNNKVATSEVVTTATANKILKLNANGALPADITGNAATATSASTANKLTSAKTISLTGDVTGSGSFDGSNNLSITATVADDSHNHVISNIDGLQGALDGKQATITGGASTITSSNLTASRALVSDANGKVAISAVTSTQLGYLSGVTSAIQTQLNNKVATSEVVTSATANKILKLDSTGKFPIAAIPQHIEFTTYTEADIV